MKSFSREIEKCLLVYNHRAPCFQILSFQNSRQLLTQISLSVRLKYLSIWQTSEDKITCNTKTGNTNETTTISKQNFKHRAVTLQSKLSINLKHVEMLEMQTANLIKTTKSYLWIIHTTINVTNKHVYSAIIPPLA